MKWSDNTTLTIVIIGAINWLLVGIFRFDLVAFLFGNLSWLSRIIYAESGNQPLAGKIAVGNVVLNRVNSPAFPNSVYAVVFQQSQFTPVMNGTIYSTPNAESVIAAKLCLEGANTAGNSLYFLAPALAGNLWTMEERTYVTTIGTHWFYR